MHWLRYDIGIAGKVAGNAFDVTVQLNCQVLLIIRFCILLRVILTVNNNTFCFATIDDVFIK
jgi:hypothetical protein